MKIQFLGSAASEGIPNPFCRCDYCQKVRSHPGKDQRSRSSVLIDDVMLIDIAPEFSQQLLREGLDACGITDLLITHTHPDHFNVGDLYARMEGYGLTIDNPLHIWGNDRAINGCMDVLPGYSDARFIFHRLIPFVSVDSGEYRITPLLANHAKWETCFLYLIEKEGVSLLYGHDSGWYPELTWLWLEGKRLDGVIVECTYGQHGVIRSDNHMNLATVFAVQERLQTIGCLHPGSQMALSHLSHTGGLLHAELEAACAGKNLTVAWDRLVINLAEGGCHDRH